MRNMFKKVICLLLLCFTLTGCLGGEFIKAEYKQVSSSRIEWTYDILKNKEIESWEVSISGSNATFYINDSVFATQSPSYGSTTMSLKMYNFDLKKGDVCKLVITGTYIATYGTKINGETLNLT